MEKFKPYAWLIAGLAMLALIWSYFRPTPSEPVGLYTEAKESPDVAKLPKTPIQGTINVLPPAAKRKTNLPQPLQNDPGTHVVDTAQFPVSYQPFTAVATYDEKTGDVALLVRNDPLPWLAAEQRSYVRVGYGVKSKTGHVGQLAVGGNLVQAKDFHLGGSAELFTDGVAYAGVHVEYQF